MFAPAWGTLLFPMFVASGTGAPVTLVTLMGQAVCIHLSMQAYFLKPLLGPGNYPNNAALADCLSSPTQEAFTRH